MRSSLNHTYYQEKYNSLFNQIMNKNMYFVKNIFDARRCHISNIGKSVINTF